MRYGILGQLEVNDGVGSVALAQGRQRLLLAVLLVHADQPVSTDRLIDALWGESPPPSAAGSLHNHVSALRKALGDSRLTRDGHGYRLHVAEGELDAQRFDALAAQGRASDDPGRTAELLREALALWRGPAFGDLAYESALDDAASALEERRLAAIEDRIDADLELGRHAELIAELDTLVAQHPLRERLRGQRMLALYRSGRQADALAAYADARRRLVDELGIEPGPALRELEQAILRQDPALGPARALPRLPRALRHPWRLAATGALLLVVVVAAVLIAGRSDPEPTAAAGVAPAGDLLVAIDPATDRITERIRVGGSPTSVTVGGRAVWALNGDDHTISRIDLESLAPRTFASEANVVELAAGDDGLWVAQSQPPAPGRSVFVGVSVPTQVTRIDPLNVVARETKPLPGPARAGEQPDPGGVIAAGGGAVWTISRGGWVHRLDTRSGELRTLRSRRADSLAVSDGQVWAYEHSDEVVRLDARTGRVRDRVPLAATWVDSIALGAGALWATARFEGVVWRIDTDSLTARTIDVGRGVDTVAFGAGSVWAGNSERGTVSRIDPGRNAVTNTFKTPGTPRALAVGGGRVWVAVAGTHEARPAAGGLSEDARVTALPGPPCSTVLTGKDGDPDFLIASDLPLQMQRATTLSMADAVAFVLRRHKFRAGRYTLGLQSCDSASAAGGGWPDDQSCRRNARLLARNPAVIGIVGPFDSPCAWSMIPILNRAPGGPPALVSPANSNPELVRREPENSDDVLGELYPTGQRGYVQLYPADDYELAAGALLAQRQGNGRVFFLEDEDSRSWGWRGTWFVRAAQRAGVELAGQRTFDARAKDHRRLARRVRESGAGAVYIASDTSRVRRLLRDLRATLDPDVAIVGGWTFTPVSTFVDQVGARRARGLLITSHGLQPESLGPAGQRFVRAFGAGPPGHRVTSVDVYSAAATEVLLDAIARSDGTREGVARALRQTRLADSVIGPIALTPTGEQETAKVSYARIEHGGGREDVLLSLTGADVLGVIEPPAKLVGEEQP